MLYNYDVEKLGQVVHDFYNATGINMIFLAENFERLTFRDTYNTKFCNKIHEDGNGNERCLCSDRKLLEKCKETRKVQHCVCHAGLIDIAVPVMLGNDILGYIILGQIKSEEAFDSVKEYLKDVKADRSILEKHYQELILYEEEKIESIINLATMLAKHIILEDMLKLRYNNSMETVIKFIDENLEKELTVKGISKGTCLSVSVLYKYFNMYFNCTPKDYINKRRVEESRKLLINTN